MYRKDNLVLIPWKDGIMDVLERTGIFHKYLVKCGEFHYNYFYFYYENYYLEFDSEEEFLVFRLSL